jgi:nicotinamidase-related amidase
MNVIELNKFRYFSETTLFAFVDLQTEYVSEGRAYFLNNAVECLSNCRRLLLEARRLRLPIAHFRRITSTQFFNKETRFSHWVEEFHPRPNEMVFEREGFSCYENNSFRDFIDHVKDPVIILAGLTGEHSCLATAVDAHRRKHNLIYVSDASTSEAIGHFTTHDSHTLVTRVINGFAQVAKTEEVLSMIGMERTKSFTGTK